MKLSDFKGYALAAAAYGTNPAFAVPLYDQGMNPNSVLLFRYVMGLPLLALLMSARGISFRISRQEAGQVAILGFLMALSSLGLFESYTFSERLNPWPPSLPLIKENRNFPRTALRHNGIFTIFVF